MNSPRTCRAVASALAVGILASCAAGPDAPVNRLSSPDSISGPTGSGSVPGGTKSPPPTSPGGPGRSSTSGRASSGAGSVTGSETASGADSGPPPSALLARQVQLSLGGDGVGPACEEDDRQIPALTESAQGVWITNLYSPTEYPWVTVLCLSGFSTSQPIEVSVVAGTYRARTRVVPVAGPPVQNVVAPHDEESPRTLFQNGASLKVYSTGYAGSAIRGPDGVFVSEMWQFTPPPAARQQIALHEAITLTATQGSRTAVIAEPVRTPTTPQSWVVPLDGPGSTNRLVLHGYPAGQVVPVGLYRRDDSTQPPKAVLLEQAGTVRVPASRVAEFAVPDRLVLSHGPGPYCVLPPVPRGQSDCPGVVVWPDYPGRVSPGDTGPAVRQWQTILIAAGWIPDTPQNHDGVYGPKTAAAVTRVFQQYVNPDGGLTLGKGAYRLFTAHVVP